MTSPQSAGEAPVTQDGIEKLYALLGQHIHFGIERALAHERLMAQVAGLAARVEELQAAPLEDAAAKTDPLIVDGVTTLTSDVLVPGSVTLGHPEPTPINTRAEDASRCGATCGDADYCACDQHGTGEAGGG
jgi:hypothetical protein